MSSLFDISTMYHGNCPRCGDYKFIGHGPLCLDCFENPWPQTEAKR